ncbi:uncharacterized protein LOC115457519 isoform X2 [Microcaecilia unicolor]|uniref:Uncharacterized protein LOC115457519 isoform X2 n=1 Tax=Microcaecilia unicolor TaxID=1415580 RepID=A0A6P7WX51_9AMPH|nr:uncharacterized protein LOC115457519 isoform X2 [Microcaecilia unicolor]
MGALNSSIQMTDKVRSGSVNNQQVTAGKAQDLESQLETNLKQELDAMQEGLRRETGDDLPTGMCRVRGSRPDTKVGKWKTLQQLPLLLDSAWVKRNGGTTNVEGKDCSLLQFFHTVSKNQDPNSLQDQMQSSMIQEPEDVLEIAPECTDLSETSEGARKEWTRTRTRTRQKCGISEAGHCCSRRVELPQWAAALTLLVFCTIITVLAAILVQKCVPCPEGWILYAGMCYNFSEVKDSWASSQEYCSTYNGTLAVLKSNQDLKTIERFKDNNYWVGLFKKEDGWWWLDGSLLPKDRNPLTNNDSSLGCAYLNSGTFGALYCKTARHCLCTRAPASCFMARE